MDRLHTSRITYIFISIKTCIHIYGFSFANSNASNHRSPTRHPCTYHNGPREGLNWIHFALLQFPSYPFTNSSMSLEIRVIFGTPSCATVTSNLTYTAPIALQPSFPPNPSPACHSQSCPSRRLSHPPPPRPSILLPLSNLTDGGGGHKFRAGH